MSTNSQNPLFTTVSSGVVGAYLYPALGEPEPEGGKEVLLLTEGGACVSGPWRGDGRFIGWCFRPEKDIAKMLAVASLRRKPAASHEVSRGV